MGAIRYEDYHDRPRLGQEHFSGPRRGCDWPGSGSQVASTVAADAEAVCAGGSALPRTRGSTPPSWCSSAGGRSRSPRRRPGSSADRLWRRRSRRGSPTLVRLGGHFDGGTVLHWVDWSEGRGVLLSGDILQVVPSGHVSFMWSYPNLIPLSAAKVQRMAEILEPFAFDAVYGAFSGRGQIDANGKQVVAASVARYIARISETKVGSNTTSV